MKLLLDLSITYARIYWPFFRGAVDLLGGFNKIKMCGLAHDRGKKSCRLCGGG